MIGNNKTSLIRKIIQSMCFYHKIDNLDEVSIAPDIIDDDVVIENKTNSCIETNNIRKVYDFSNTHTNILIDLKSDYITSNIRNHLEKIIPIKNTEYKRIYFQKNLHKSNLILFKFLNDNFEIKKLENEFDDDKTENYIVIINRNNKDEISFVEYVLSREYWKPEVIGGYTIYNYSIHLIVNVLFSDCNFKNQVIDFINKDELFIVENKEKKENIIGYINNIFIEKNDSDVEVKIVNKLLKKYDTDKLGLLIILLYKYGEEVAFDLPQYESFEHTVHGYDVGLINKSKTDENKKKYNEIFNSLDIKDFKWKSEISMFKLIQTYFPDAIYQYRFKELGLQSLDVFVPSINIGFEYQGVQHYKNIEIFGGEEDFEKRLENDKKKKRICRENNIDLIEWKYNEKIDKLTLDIKLLNYKNKIGNSYKFTNLN